MKILYIGCENNIFPLFISIIEGFKRIEKEINHIIVNPSNLLYKEMDENNDDIDLFKGYNIVYKKIIPSEVNKKYKFDIITNSYLLYLDLFNEIKPDAIVIPHELGYAFFAVQVAKTLKIPTYHIQHGLWGPSKFVKNDNEIKTCKRKNFILNKIVRLKRIITFLLKTINTRYANVIPERISQYKISLISPPQEYSIFADKFAVCGPYYEGLTRNYVKNITNDKIEDIGYLRLDNLIREESKTREQLCKDYGFQEDSKMALYFYSSFQEFPDIYNLNYDPDQALLDAILSLKQIDNKFNILVLLHPNFKFGYYSEKIRNKLNELKIDRVIVDKARNNHSQLYKNSSIVIGVKSACLYEAMLFNVAVVVQQYVLSKVFNPQYYESGAVAPVFFPGHLDKQMKKALFDEDFRKCMFQNQNKLCADLMGPFDGESGIRAAKSILELISGSRKVDLL